MIKYLFRSIFILLAGCIIISCEESFLEKKPDKSLVVPHTLEDLGALIYNYIHIMNRDPAVGIIASDDIYITPEGLEGLSVKESNIYLWTDDVFESSSVWDWSRPYEQVFYANVALEILKDIAVDDANRQEWNNIKGSALFYRANAFYNLANIFTMPYDEKKASSIPGIPLRLNADVKKGAARASLQETYGQILEDLKRAARLLPPIAEFKTQPSRATAFAMASRVFLSMHDYQKARVYADSCLRLHNVLLDYNAIDGTKSAPFTLLNEEVLFQSTVLSYSVLVGSELTFVDPELYASYDNNDLRHSLFFKENENGMVNFTGTYNGDITLFTGIATDELFLIRAECRARLGDISGAMDDLNTLLETRWKEGTFEPFTASSKEAAVAIILEERRKELVFRGRRWSDLRRLNQYPAYAKTLVREINGETYTLPAGDSKYAFPIPYAEIEGSGIAQNPR